MAQFPYYTPHPLQERPSPPEVKTMLCIVIFCEGSGCGRTEEVRVFDTQTAAEAAIQTWLPGVNANNTKTRSVRVFLGEEYKVELVPTYRIAGREETT